MRKLILPSLYKDALPIVAFSIQTIAFSSQHLAEEDQEDQLNAAVLSSTFQNTNRKAISKPVHLKECIDTRPNEQTENISWQQASNDI